MQTLLAATRLGHKVRTSCSHGRPGLQAGDLCTGRDRPIISVCCCCPRQALETAQYAISSVTVLCLSRGRILFRETLDIPPARNTMKGCRYCSTGIIGGGAEVPGLQTARTVDVMRKLRRRKGSYRLAGVRTTTHRRSLHPKSAPAPRLQQSTAHLSTDSKTNGVWIREDFSRSRKCHLQPGARSGVCPIGTLAHFWRQFISAEGGAHAARQSPESLARLIRGCSPVPLLHYAE